MSDNNAKRSVPLWAVALTLILLVGFAAVFLMEFWVASTVPADHEEVLTAQTYLDEIEPLLVNANPERGQRLIAEKYECATCHVQGSGRIAPGYEGLADRAGSERPPLVAAAYVYESILHPAAHLVEGYQNAMPANYADRLSDDELGDMIAYLLTQ